MPFGPPQFRMNRGTALKWLDALRQTDWQFDPGQLSFNGPQGVYGTPEGLLARFLDPSPVTGWDGVSHIYNGAQFYLSDAARKRAKVQGRMPEFRSFADAIAAIENMVDHYAQTAEPRKDHK